MAGLNFFSVVDFFAGVRDVRATFNLIENIELKPPDNVSGIFNVAGLLERFKRNGICVIGTIEGGYDDEGGIGIALKDFEFANSVINAVFYGVF